MGARPYGGLVAGAGRVSRLSASLLRAAAIATVAALVVGVSISATSAASASPCGSSSAVPQYKHIVVIAFENHSYGSILGSAAPASYFKTLASECGTATSFTSASFPHSLPNYLAVTGGTTGGVTGDCLPSTHCSVSTPSIFDQVGSSSWRVWAESMPQPCDSQNQSTYVTRHNPPLYYPTIATATCQADDQPMPAAVPNPSRSITWITPNLQHDLTIGTLTDASTWLRTLLTGPSGLLQSKSYSAGNTAIFIWFDSGADTDSCVNTDSIDRDRTEHRTPGRLNPAQRLPTTPRLGKPARRAVPGERLYREGIRQGVPALSGRDGMRAGAAATNAARARRPAQSGRPRTTPPML